MKLYRYSVRQWARSIDGTGAKLYGGRYNPEGFAAVYCCFNPSLPYLECLAANLKHATWPRYYLTHFELDENALVVEEFQVDKMPDDWDHEQHKKHVQQWSVQELTMRDAIILPSRVNPLDRTIILNPARPKFEKRIKIIDVREMKFDQRLFGN
jgi:RES domain-containing protein